MQHFEFEVSIDNTENDIKKLYTLIRPDVKVEDIKYENFNEGVVNLIVKLDDSKSNSPLVIRTYGLKMKQSKTEGFNLSKFENRELELEALKQASDLGITAKIIATYSNGFVYKYIDGEVSSYELYDSELAKKTAIKMVKFHTMDLKELAGKNPLVYTFLGNDEMKGMAAHFDQIMLSLNIEEYKKYQFILNYKKSTQIYII